MSDGAAADQAMAPAPAAVAPAEGQWTWVPAPGRSGRSSHPKADGSAMVRQRKARQSGATRLAWALSGLSAGLAVVSVALAAVNGITPVDLVLEHLGIGTASAIVYPVLGALIITRQPRNWFGWVAVAQGVPLGVFVFTQQYALLALGLSVEGVSLPGGTFTSWLASWTMMPGIVLGQTLVVLLFPDGQPPSRRWWPAAWAGIAVALISSGVQAAETWPLRGPELARVGFVAPTETAETAFGLGFLLATVLLAVGVVGVVLRFRRAAGVQRQQIKWFAYGGIVTLLFSINPEYPVFGPILELLTVPVLAGAIGIAIFRHRLYEIDRIINRTIVYGLLTASLAGVYAVGVLVVEQAFTAGREVPGPAVAATTLAVAALFQPLRRRIQNLVDRRFNRRRFDAARTIDSFAARLRQQTDLDALTVELLTVVDQTMQPTRATLWLRPTGRHR